MTELLASINRFVWGVPALLMILGVGILLSFKTGFAQIRFLPKALKRFWQMICGKKDADSFHALCTALSATVGTGNIVGVAGAICLGGPGSIFWMWICGIFGMVTKYAEASLSVIYRCKTPDGQLMAGPMYMITMSMRNRWKCLAIVYSLFGCIAAFGVGNATQINALVESAVAAVAAFGGSLSGPGRLLLAGTVTGMGIWCLLGGVKRVGSVSAVLIPLASGVYIVLCVGALIARWDAIPQALYRIILGAFRPEAVTCGLLGSACTSLRIGASRGVFTNEAGMGTAAMAHGTADPDHPAEQGLMGIMEVFLDTIVLCTITALVILTSGVPIPYGMDAGVNLVSIAFSSIYGSGVNIMLSLFLGLFAFGTILGWGFYGMQCAEFLFGAQGRAVFLALMGMGSLAGILLKTGPVWLLSETVNGLMAIPNLILLTSLCPEVKQLTAEYKKLSAQRRSTANHSHISSERRA